MPPKRTFPAQAAASPHHGKRPIRADGAIAAIVAGASESKRGRPRQPAGEGRGGGLYAYLMKDHAAACIDSSAAVVSDPAGQTDFETEGELEQGMDQAEEAES